LTRAPRPPRGWCVGAPGTFVFGIAHGRFGIAGDQPIVHVPTDTEITGGVRWMERKLLGCARESRGTNLPSGPFRVPGDIDRHRATAGSCRALVRRLGTRGHAPGQTPNGRVLGGWAALDRRPDGSQTFTRGRSRSTLGIADRLGHEQMADSRMVGSSDGSSSGAVSRTIDPRGIDASNQDQGTGG
jgi:hypothetical protein